MEILEEVVLRQAYLPARDQGLRPTCIAFALSEVNLQHAPDLDALSPEHLYQEAASSVKGWLPGDGIPLDLAIRAASARQPAERDYPYQQEEPSAPVMAPPRGSLLYGGQMRLGLHDSASLIKILRDQRPVGLGLQLTPSFYCPVAGVVEYEEDIVEGALHAVVAVGLGWRSSEPYFLIRNSWGPGWGIGGNAWLPSAYIGMHAICAFGE